MIFGIFKVILIITDTICLAVTDNDNTVAKILLVLGISLISISLLGG